MAGFDVRQIPVFHRGAMIAAVVVFIASFFPYVGTSGFLAVSMSPWSTYAVIGLLLLFATAVFTAVRSAGVTTLPSVPGGWDVWSAGAAALGTILLILRAVTVSSMLSIQWGAYVLFVAAIVQTICTGLQIPRTAQQRA